MAETPLVKKLGLKPGYRAAILNAPAGYREQITPLPPRVTLGDAPAGPLDWVVLFARNQAELARGLPGVLAAVQPGGIFWIAYPKRSAKVPTDITRDTGWEALHQVGWQGVSLVAIDAVWSAMRFRPIP